MSLVDVLGGLLRPAVCLACGVPGVWPCCACCLPAEPDDVGPWPLAADPDVALWALGPYRDALRAAVLAGKLDGQPADLAELGRRRGGAAAALDLPLIDLLAPARGRDLGLARRAARSGRPPPPRPPPAARRRLAGGRVLLVDDLATTGRTLAGAADTLRLAGARQVQAAVLATGPAALAGVAGGGR